MSKTHDDMRTKLADSNAQFCAQDVRDLLAEYDALVARATWRPIETAPRPNVRFLFWNGSRVCAGMFFRNGMFAAQGYPDNGIPEPTHWMPLPEPPR